ncbi:MAG TPA: tail fiber domain-containing protein [Verrucomicrobiae bacterium]|nr:tail fiber domain-containing protein [Verrucomicrobiae bacterium]
MKNRAQRLLAALALLSTLQSPLSTCLAQGTAFTYQGQLQDNGALASGNFNLKFTLFNTNVTGTAVAGPVTNNSVAVSNGLFTATIDFGDAVWNGETNWLEIAVETNGGGSFTKLSPRQQVTPTPYAITAENLDGTVGSSGLSGTYGSMVTMNNPANQFTGAFTGDGSALTNANAATLGGLNASGFWQLGGNTAASGSQIVGTLNNQPFDLYADGVRALRLVLHTDASGTYSNAPNVIGGSSLNGATTGGVVGVTIAGGGGNSITGGLTYPNQVSSSFDTIGGGFNNSVSGEFSVIAGGGSNVVNGGSAVISGGFANIAGGDDSAVVGGMSNNAAASGSFIGGGGYDGTTTAGNFVNANAAAIAGGLGNRIPSGSEYAFIGGGAYNTNHGHGSFIGGGGYDGSAYLANVIQTDGATIGGGLGNSIPGGGAYSFIGGGVENTASGGAATVAGGQLNTASSGSATVGGGDQNFATNVEATVGGGALNIAGGSAATVPGGFGNIAAGIDSFAAGTGATVNNDYSFLWADSGATSDRDAEFKIQASSGVYMDVSGSSGLNPAALEVNSESANGVALHAHQSSSDCTAVFGNSGTGDLIKGFSGSGSGTLVFEVKNDGTVLSKGVVLTSDRGAKENFAGLDSAAVLAKVAALPVTEWNYRNDPEGIKHIGPVAQDFHAAFELNGADDKHISVVDEGGVALAAIQGLNEKLEGGRQKEENQIEELKAENAELKGRLEKLEQLMESKSGGGK